MQKRPSAQLPDRANGRTPLAVATEPVAPRRAVAVLYDHHLYNVAVDLQQASQLLLRRELRDHSDEQFVLCDQHHTAMPPC